MCRRLCWQQCPGAASSSATHRVDAGACGAQPIEQAPPEQVGPADIDSLPPPDRVPEGFPEGVGLHHGYTEHPLPNGRRALIATAGEAQEQEGAAPSASISLAPSQDTWAQRVPGAAWQDFGKSCELRVNNILTSNVPQAALLRFTLPDGLPCATLSARLVMKTAHFPAAPGLRVYAHRIHGPWAPGPTGAAQCSQCSVSSGQPYPFTMPQFTPQTFADVQRPCTIYSWDVTAMARAWCAAPASNLGVLLAGRLGNQTVNFHSMESPIAGDRPRLIIIY